MNRHPIHGEIYICKRLRMLEFLRNKGHMPFKIMPDVNNPKYNVFYFTNTAELEDSIYEYFEMIEKRKNNGKKEL